MSQKDMEALIVGSRRQVNLDVFLPNNARADIQVPSAGGELHFSLLREGSEVHRDDFYNGFTDSSGVSQPTRLVRQSNGRYYYPFDTSEHSTCGLYQAIWDYRIANQFDYETEWQLIRVIPTSTLELIEDLRLILDKALKYYNDKVPTPTRIGYSTGMLVKYLELGLAGINAQPPYPTWASLELFPKAYKSLLIKAALYWGVTSQLLYAIDTDITNYSDNGLAYVKQHAPQLAAYLTSIKDDLKSDLSRFKMQFVSIGSVVMRNTISYRWDTLIQNAPNGATLRGFFTTPL